MTARNSPSGSASDLVNDQVSVAGSLNLCNRLRLSIRSLSFTGSKSLGAVVPRCHNHISLGNGFASNVLSFEGRQHVSGSSAWDLTKFLKMTRNNAGVKLRLDCDLN